MSSPIALPLDGPEMVFGVSGAGEIRRSVLPSGIRVLTEVVPGARSVTLGYAIVRHYESNKMLSNKESKEIHP